MSFIRQRLKGQKSSILALIAIGLCLVFPGLVIPVFSQFFVDDILLGGNSDWVTALLVVMGCTIVFQQLLTYYRGMLLEKLQNKMALVSAHEFLSHMFHLQQYIQIYQYPLSFQTFCCLEFDL